MRCAKIVLLPCLALAVAACGSSKSTTSAAVTTPTHTVTVTTSATTTSATTTSQTTTTPSGSPVCRASTLALSFIGSQGAAGHGLLGFELKNTGSATCSTIGYPGVTFLDKAGQALPTDTTRTTQDYFGSAPKVLLNVSPGSSVSFRIGVTHVPAGNATCATAAGLQVIPPNDTSTMSVSIPGGAYYCQTATVSPVRPGTSAYPGP